MPYTRSYFLPKIGHQLCLIGLFVFCLPFGSFAQSDTLESTPHPKADLLDVVQFVFPNLALKKRDTTTFKAGSHYFLVLPESGYSIQTSFLAQVTGNLSFRRTGANVSTVITTATYTFNKQELLTITTNIWSRNNRFNLVGDWRIEHYPQQTFGLGIHTDRLKEIRLDYSYLRFYQSVLARVRPNLYAGVGYAYDRHFNMVSSIGGDVLTTISGYPYGVSGNSVSSGPRLSLIYDNRDNAINPDRGFYADFEARAALTALGSSQAYQSVMLDVRKYIPLPGRAENILAFWSYNVLTISGNPPYMDLPATSTDKYGNSGRGYIQGRFRGQRLLYTEAEYRFAITRNRLFGGVVFANAQTVTEPFTHHFDGIVPGMGAGIRFQMNKISRTNLCVDYGIGADGSRGIFFNLGEVF